MQNNFRTLISGVLAKASTLFPKKEDVYTKKEAATKSELKALTHSDVGAAPKKHEHSYMEFKSTPARITGYKQWASITYGADKFVAVALNSDMASYSHDGITWMETTLPAAGEWTSVAYGGNMFVLVGTGIDKALYSHDGITWMETTLPAAGEWTHVAYGGGKFVAIGPGEKNHIIYSNDGITWEEAVIPDNGREIGITSIAYNDFSKSFIMTDSRNCRVCNWKVDDGSWTYQSMQPIGESYTINPIWCSIACNGPADGIDAIILAISQDADIVARSVSGSVWYKYHFPNGQIMSQIIYGNDVFVAIAPGTNIAFYTYDGKQWYTTILPYCISAGSIAFGDGKFVIIANFDRNVIISEDGIHWKTELNEIYQDGELITPEQLGLTETGEEVSLDGYATEQYVNDKTTGLATEQYVNDKIVVLATQQYVSNRINQAITGAIGGSY